MLYLHITDIHMGTPAVPPKSVHDGLKKTFFDDARFAGVDALLITGDVFDQSLDHSSEEATWAARTINMILRFCKKHNIVLIVLEGTPLHDRKQSRWFGVYNDLHEIDCIIYYFTDLTVEYIPELGKRILAVPDEVAKPRIRVDDKIALLLKKQEIDQVDIALTHGFYDHLLPKMKYEEGHQSEYFQKIVKEFVANGHVHTPNVHRPKAKDTPIITGGSAIRKAHGEEEAKGGHLIEVTDNGEVNVMFIRNKMVVPFVTVDVRSKNLTQATKKIEKVVKDWEIGNCLIHSLKNDPIRDIVAHLRDKYPHIKFKTKVETVELSERDTNVYIGEKIQSISINNRNIYSLVEEASHKINIDDSKRQRALDRLMQLL